MTTDKQKKAVYFCELFLDIEFNGDIDDFNEVSNFLNNYLDCAKDIYEDAYAGYYGEFMY